MVEPQAQSGESRVLAHLDRDVVGFLEDFADPSQEWRRLFSELWARSSSCWSRPVAG
jgi:hypothetical protein